MTDNTEPTIEQKISDIIASYLVLATDNGQPYIQYDDTAVDKITNLISDQVAKASTQAENTLKLDLYSIQPDELDEIVSKCEGKHTQQVVYSTYHKGFTRICFGCMQVDTTIKVIND